MQTERAETAIPRNHGVVLSLYLLLMVVGNLYGAFLHFSATEEITSLAPRVTTELTQLLGVLCVLNIGLAAGIWAWRKWAVYGVYAMAATGFAINLYIGLPLAQAALGLTGLIVIYFTTSQRWEHFS